MDDDLIARFLLYEALKISGFEDVALSASGIDALRKINLSENPFDCFLLDIQMDGLGGIALCEKIRAMPQYQEAPIIMVTAMHEKSFVDSAFAAGATDYVTKPFDMLELGTRVRIAEKISSKIKNITKKESEISSLKRLVENLTPNPPKRPVRIVAEGYKELKLFEICLQNTPYADLLHVALVACQILNFRQTEPHRDVARLEVLLGDVATAIYNTFAGRSIVTTYGGNGVFLSAFKDQPPSEDEKIFVQNNLNQISINNDIGYRGLTQLQFGKPVWFNRVSAQDPIKLVRAELNITRIQSKILDAPRKERSQVSNPTLAQSELNRRLQLMVPHYLAVLYESLSRLDVLKEKISLKKCTREDFEEIKMIVHRIAGVAPTLRFGELGYCAAETEQIISKTLKKNDIASVCVEIEMPLKVLLDLMEDTIVENIVSTQDQQDAPLGSQS